MCNIYFTIHLYCYNQLLCISIILHLFCAFWECTQGKQNCIDDVCFQTKCQNCNNMVEAHSESFIQIHIILACCWWTTGRPLMEILQLPPADWHQLDEQNDSSLPVQLLVNHCHCIDGLLVGQTLPPLLKLKK